MSKEINSPLSPFYQPRPCDENCIRALVDFWQNGSQKDVYFAQIDLEMEKKKPEGQRDYWQIYLSTEALQRCGFSTIPDREKED